MINNWEKTMQVFHGKSPFKIQSSVLKKYFFRDGIVVFREIDMTPTDLVRLGKTFGSLLDAHLQNFTEEYPSVLRVSPKNGVLGFNKVDWHSDYSYKKEGFWGSLLYAVKADSTKTYWADMQTTYQCLAKDLQNALKSIWTTSDSISSVANYPVSPIEMRFARMLGRQKKLCVQSHPITGAPTLFLNLSPVYKPKYSQDFDFARVWQIIDETTYAHSWQDGDLILFDNFRLIHKRDQIQDPQRLMLRIQFDYQISNAEIF